MIHQNLTQFCYANGYPSEFDILEHGMLGESGHIAKRTKEHLMDAHCERLNKHIEAVNLFCEKIMNDEIIDINGKYIKADLILSLIHISRAQAAALPYRSVCRILGVVLDLIFPYLQQITFPAV